MTPHTVLIFYSTPASVKSFLFTYFEHFIENYCKIKLLEMFAIFYVTVLLNLMFVEVMYTVCEKQTPLS